MQKFANWDQALGFYSALYDMHGLQLDPAIATRELASRLLAMATGPDKIGSENAPIFVASTTNSPIFVASTAGSPISVSSTTLTPVAAPWGGACNFLLRVPKGAAPFCAQSVGTPTPSRTLQPFLIPTPSPNFGKATPSPAASLTSSGAILILDSDSDDDHTCEKGKGKQPRMQPIPRIGNVIVIGDSDNNSALPQKPYPSSPSHPLALSPTIPATPLKGTRCFKPLFPDGYSPGKFFNAEGSPNAPNVSLRACQLEQEIEKYMKTPPTGPQVSSTPRAAANGSPSALNVSLRAHQLEKEIEKYMKMPPTDPQARSTPRGAASATKSPVSSSAWKSSLKTAKKPRLNRTQTFQDRKFPGPSKTATAVWSSVPQDFGNFKTNKRPV